MSGPPLIVVLGPTAVGKSALAMDLARRRRGAILSADAMQVYRGFDLGTTKPGAGARAEIPHYLVDIADPRADFSAGDFVRAADAALAEVRARGLAPILAGGTGLYVRAFLRGLFAGPRRDAGLRRRLAALKARGGPARLHRLLARLDPGSAARLPPADTQRVVRAVEVCLLTGRPFSDHLEQDAGGIWAGGERLEVRKIGLKMARERLVARIEARVAAFFAAGLVEEVRGLLAAGVPPTANAFKGIGYRESLAVAQGRMDEAEARERTLVATRRYAKRQMTWFRREKDINWVDAGQEPGEVLRAAEEWLR